MNGETRFFVFSPSYGRCVPTPPTKESRVFFFSFFVFLWRRATGKSKLAGIKVPTELAKSGVSGIYGCKCFDFSSFCSKTAPVAPWVFWCVFRTVFRSFS